MRLRALPSPLSPLTSFAAIGCAAIVLVLVAFVAGCGGGGNGGATGEDEETGPIRSATPYAVMPTPFIVTGATGNTSSSSGSGGTTTTGDVSYVVVSGDTLFALATKYDTTVEAIMTKNGLTSASDLRVGQQLTITRGSSSVATATPNKTATAAASPAATVKPTTTAGRTYTVVNGDLAGAIASRFSVTLEQLAAANNRSVASLDALQIGEVLNIPGS